MSEVTIHGFPQSSYVWTARAICAAKGVDVDFQPMAPGDQRHEEYLAMHPFAKVPFFSHGDFELYETSAICHYVDRAFDGPALIPEDDKAAAHVERWISVVNSYLYGQAVPGLIFAYMFPGTEDGSPDTARIEATLPKLRRTLAVFDEALEGGGWLVGDAPTAADYFAAPLMMGIHHVEAGKALIGEFPAIQRYLGQLVQLESLMNAAPTG